MAQAKGNLTMTAKSIAMSFSTNTPASFHHLAAGVSWRARTRAARAG